MATMTEVDAPITMVTVFRDRAQVRRTTVLSLEPGEHTVAWNGMWSFADRDSVQVSMGTGAQHALLRSVQFTTRHSTEDVRPLKKELRDRLEGLQLEEQSLQDQRTIVQTRVDALKAVQAKIVARTTTHNDAQRDTAKWAEFAAFFRAENEANSTRLRELSVALEDVQKRIRDANNRLSALGGDTKVTQKDVAEVSLVVTAATKLQLQLSYMVRNASWSPLYDLRADSKAKTLAVTYYAMVRQSTGEPWLDARVTLSTAKPTVGGTAPQLSQWNCGIQTYNYNNSARYDVLEDCVAPQMMMQQMVATNMFVPPPPAAAAAPLGGAAPVRSRVAATSVAATVEASATSATFAIPGSHKIRSDNEPVKLTIMHAVFPVHLRYSAVPKLDPHVYLKAKAINVTDFQFLKGKANVYADNQFVSTTQMDDVAPTEEWWTFLGVDDSLKATRQLVHRKRSEVGGMLSSKRKRVEFKYTFKLKNSKATEEELVIWDQLPICENKSITCSLIEPNDKSRFLYKTNELQAIEWFANLKPREEATLSFVFAVEYPTDEHVTGL